MAKKLIFFLAFGAICLLILAGFLVDKVSLAAPAEPNASYSIPWWTVDSGGGSSQGGAYVLNGTAGQADAGTLTGGSYTLNGGFWGGTVSYVTYLPLTMR